MRIVHIAFAVDTQSASYRLHKALLENGITSSILVVENSYSLTGVFTIEDKYKIKESVSSKIIRKIKTRIRKKYISKEKGPFSSDCIGHNLANHPLILEADIVHLHWIINTISIRSIKDILLNDKKVIWTCHDNWPFTGGCHVRYNCNGFKSDCANCLYSKNKGKVAKKFLKIKKRCLVNRGLVLTGPSNWMVSNLKESIFMNEKIYKLQNCVDTAVFKPMNKYSIREYLGFDSSKIIIGISVMDTGIPYKGWAYIVELMARIRKEAAIQSKIEFVIMGNGKPDGSLPFKIHRFGYLSEEHLIAEIYNACDFTINPSLEESFSNVVLESISCGVPVLAFSIGGIPDIIDHKKNGYLAEAKNINDLYNGFVWICNNINNRKVIEACRSKAIEHFSLYSIFNRAKSIYNEVLYEQ